MTTLIIVGLVLAVAFIAGALFFRKNSKNIDAVIKKAQDVRNVLKK